MTARITILVLRVLLIFPLPVLNHEKSNNKKKNPALRKIVRDQSKMVQKPFSANDNENLAWNRAPVFQPLSDSNKPGIAQTKFLHRVQRPKMSTLLTSSSLKFSKSIQVENDIRLSRHIESNNIKPALQPYRGTEYFPEANQSNLTPSINLNIESYYQIPTASKFFPELDDQSLQDIEQKSNKLNNVNFPEMDPYKENVTSIIQSIYIANKNGTKRISKPLLPSQKDEIVDVENIETENEKADFFLNGSPVDADYKYAFNASVNPYICKALGVTQVDIDAQEKFASFDIEPSWMSRKHFWTGIYDSRYESLLRNTKWPPLQVILVPLSHVDTIWRKTFENYHKDSVGKILSNVVKKLQFYSNLTFTWNEISHLSRWWKKITPKTRSVFKKLLKSGRLEITTGAWVEPDEATTHLFGLVHLFVEGHEWLKKNLNYSPKTAWLTNSVTHSPTMTYLLSTLDIVQLVMTNIHYSWEEYLAEYQYSDFVWLQSWNTDQQRSSSLNDMLGTIGKDRFPKNSVLTHYLQFNSDDFSACGPHKAICSAGYNFAKSTKILAINAYNVKEKSEILLEQFSKTGTITPHNIVIAPIGGRYAYERQPEFDYQYSNYQKIVDFVNLNKDIYKATLQFGTPKDYFSIISKKTKKYATVKGDFLNFADVDSGTPAYWTGFYTSRPFFKIMLRRLESTLRTTEILFSFALGVNVFQGYNSSHIVVKLLKARESLARLLDRNVASGTLPSSVLRYAHDLIVTTVSECWYIQEVIISLLTSKPGYNKPYLHKYIYREGEFITSFKTVSPDDQIYIFNSLSHERTEVIELVTRNANIRVVDYNRKDITVQINPIWKYISDNVIKISRRFFKISFAVVLPPLTLQLFKISTTYDALQNVAHIYCSSCVVDDVPSTEGNFPFNIQPIQTGDILLESYKQRLIFDEMTGFLKTVVEKDTNIAKTVVIDFGAFRDADVNSGIFLFNTNVSKPLADVLMPYRIGIKTKITMIVSGLITTEIISVFGRFLQHTIRIYNMLNGPLANAIYIESKVDYDVSPKNRDLEFFMSIQTDIGNGNPPQIITDNNGFQHTARVLNISRRIESNIYPITNMAYIQDHRSRLTYLTDHAQGVTSLQEGQLLIIMDRRVLYNDGRGANEGLADSSATCHKQMILLENFLDAVDTDGHHLTLPSLSAYYLSNSLNNIQDIFLVERNKTDRCHYGFLPLIKMSFPCDVSVVNFRAVLNVQSMTLTTALLILHRQSFSCRVETSSDLRCNGELDFSLDKILRNVRAVYQTNLAGTNDGIPLFTFSPLNFPSMEISTLRVDF